jgi:hypothetical protein
VHECVDRWVNNSWFVKACKKYMSEQTQRQFLDLLIGNPILHGGVRVGDGPPKNPAINAFLATVALNGATAAGNTGKTIDAKYSFMSIPIGKGRAASNDNTFFTRPVGEFFCLLFRKVSETIRHRLHKSDLWHGHLVQTRTQGVCIVFHAKEYPRDLLVDGTSANQTGNFSSEDNVYRWRNVLWRASDNGIFKVDAGVYKKSTQTLVHNSQLFNNVIEDAAQEWDAFGAGNDKRAARTLEQEILGRQRVDLYYLVDESFLTWKSSHIILVARG